MAAVDTPHDELVESSRAPVQKRTRRSYVACYRCHTHKVKCSGGQPCRRCEGTKAPETCTYPARDRKVVVSESYLQKLEAESARVRRSRAHDGDDTAQTGELSSVASRATSQGRQMDQDIGNPLQEHPNMYHLDLGLRQHFVGESTSTAFGNRLLQCLQPQWTASSLPTDDQFAHYPLLARQIAHTREYKLPERIRANLLVRIALRFIGQDYHFLLRNEFLEQLEQAYAISKEGGDYDPVWGCKFFALLALGELYACSSVAAASTNVPGTDYFLQAVSLLKDQYEEPTVAQVEVMLLLYFYSHALGRVKSAHVYSGLALRYCTSLGLHRSQAMNNLVNPVEREHRIRLWWTSYTFDRSTSSRLGQPLTIQDADIDVEMPSMEQLSISDQEKFCSPAHLIANTDLARIEGSIMRNIYSISSSTNGTFVHNVRQILTKLRDWDAKLPVSLRWIQGASNRPLASLQLHYNECIMLTTRPVLLHVLKEKNPFVTGDATTNNEPALSETALALADSCISAARTMNSLLSQLYIENALAIFGYFDAHYLFSSTLVLIISALVSPSSKDSNSVQTAFHLLKIMCDKGSMPAQQYYPRLAHIQRAIGTIRSQTTRHGTVAFEGAGVTPVSTMQLNPPTMDSQSDLSVSDWTNFLLAETAPESYDGTNFDNVLVDPLDNPLLQSFLDHVNQGGSHDISMDDLMSYA